VDGAALRGSLGAPNALPAAVAEILTGLLITMSRRKGLSIIVGLLIFENGLALTAFSLTYGMPLVIEFGVLFDLLIAIVAVWVYARRMLTVLGTMDTDELRSLRG
jgi:hydrogenase-4 component E